MVEGDGLENRYTPRGYRGFESLALRHFFAKKNGERSRKASLHAATAALHSKGAAFSSHLHKNKEALLVKTLHFIPLVKSFALLTCEVAACRREDVFLFTALRLHGGKPP